LLNLRDDAAGALQKLSEVAGRLPDNLSTKHHFYDLLGRAYIGLSRRDEAIAAFRAMTDPELVRRVSPRSLCFSLAKLFVAQGLLLAECRRYLDAVESKARAHSDLEVAEMAVALKDRLPPLSAG
jgi:hypothetical protein